MNHLSKSLVRTKKTFSPSVVAILISPRGLWWILAFYRGSQVVVFT